MRLQSPYFLTIFLLFAAGFPPPQMSTILILDSSAHELSGVKVPQVRGRNRVPSPPCSDPNGLEASFGSGNDGDFTLKISAEFLTIDRKALLDDRFPGRSSHLPIRSFSALRMRC